MERDVIVGKIYKHVSGNYYRVLCIANDTTENVNGEPRQLVVYESLGKERKVWVRPYDLFNALNNDENYVQRYRFELVDDSVGLEV